MTALGHFRDFSSTSHVPATRNHQILSAMTRTLVKIIDDAIRIGVPAYNNGDIRRCVEVYTSTARRLLADEGLPTGLRSPLSDALVSSGSDELDSHAWQLRRGLDATHAALISGDMPTAIQQAISVGVPQWNRGDFAGWSWHESECCNRVIR